MISLALVMTGIGVSLHQVNAKSSYGCLLQACWGCQFLAVQWVEWTTVVNEFYRQQAVILTHRYFDPVNVEIMIGVKDDIGNSLSQDQIQTKQALFGQLQVVPQAVHPFSQSG